MKTVGLTAASLVLFALAWVCLVHPERIQTYALSKYRGKWFPSKAWISTSQYLLSVGFCGVGALIMGLLAAYAAVENLHH
jgi:hypothetical protein